MCTIQSFRMNHLFVAIQIDSHCQQIVQRFFDYNTIQYTACIEMVIVV